MSESIATSAAPQARLDQWPTPLFVLYVVAAAFTTYFCMYAFRKPFLAVPYAGESAFGFELKAVLAISQIAGYTISKYAGIKICSEVSATQRAKFLVGLIVFAEATLVLFAILPGNWKLVAIFLNGLPLGMVWGVVLLYLEGRRTSELLLAGLSCSYVIASGVVKDIGRAVISNLDVDVWWMPAVTGLLFLPPFVIAVLMLDRVPPPDLRDQQERTKRAPMDKQERHEFLRYFAVGLALQLLLYFFVTAFRDFRDIYGIEVFAKLGYGERPAIFTSSELLVAFVSMGALAVLNLIRSNKLGLLGNYAIMLSGVLFLAVGTWLFRTQQVDGLTWMILIGMGAYLIYVPNGSVFFDRLLATTRYTGTAVFAIYIMDAVGYTGSIALQILKDLLFGEVSHVDFLAGFAYFLAALGFAILTFNSVYFMRKANAAA